MGSFSIWHWVIVGVVVMMLFGRGKVSELMGDVAKGIKAFKKGMADDEAPAVAAPAAPATTVPPEPLRSIEHHTARAAEAQAARERAV